MLQKTSALWAILAALPGVAYGTSCAVPPPCASLVSGVALFIGEVIAVDRDPSNPKEDRDTARLRIQEVFLGIPSETKEITVLSSWPEVGKTYFMDTARLDDGRLVPRGCGGSGELGDLYTDDVVSYLREVRGGQDVKSSLSVSLFASYERMVNSEIVLHGPTGNLTGRTNEWGSAQFAGLSPGTYKISRLPDHYLQDKDVKQDAEIQLLPGACPNLQVFLLGDGRVSGVLWTELGPPVSGVAVELVKMGDERTFHATTNAEGAFQFESISPGRYKLGTNIGQKSSVIPRHYYPAGTDANNAAVIEVQAGGEVRDLWMQIPDYGPTREIRFRVLDETGSPVAGAYIRDSALADHPEIGALGGRELNGLKTDSSGVVSARGREGVPYRVRAGLYEGRPLVDWKVSDDAAIQPGRGPIEVTLKIHKMSTPR